MEFIKRVNMSVAVMPNDKGTIDESMPQFIGLYAGNWSSSQDVCQAIADADLVLDIGGIVETELNTGLWTSTIEPAKLVGIHDPSSTLWKFEALIINYLR